MNYRRFARLVRAVRTELSLRQVDVAAAAGVSQRTVSRIECCECGQLSGDTLQAVADALSIRLALDASWHGARGDRLVDSRHAALVDSAVMILGDRGWKVRVEYSFNHYGDRGIVDVLAWHEEAGALLVVEVKSELGDLQETLGRLDVKVRVVPRVVRDDLGHCAKLVGAALVLPDTQTARNQIKRHEAIFGAALPARTVAVRQWLLDPAGALRGVWFLSHPDMSRLRNSAVRRNTGAGGAATVGTVPQAGRHSRFRLPPRVADADAPGDAVGRCRESLHGSLWVSKLEKWQLGRARPATPRPPCGGRGTRAGQAS